MNVKLISISHCKSALMTKLDVSILSVGNQKSCTFLIWHCTMHQHIQQKMQF